MARCSQLVEHESEASGQRLSVAVLWALARHSDRSLAAMATRGLTLQKLHFETFFCLGGLQHMCFG